MTKQKPQEQRTGNATVTAAPFHEPPDPPSARAGAAGLSTGSSVSAQENASLLPRLELVVLPLAAALGLLLLFLAVPMHRLAGIAGGVAPRRGEIAVVIVVILNSLAIGILIAQLGR